MKSLVRSIDDSGFTLIELMVVVAILGILILIAVASFSYSSSTAARATCDHNRTTFETSAALYRNAHDVDPEDLQDLEPYIANFDKARVCPADGATVLRYDAVTDSIICDFHQ